MAQPQGNHCDVHSRLQQMESTCVSKYVRKNMFVVQARATYRGSFDRSLQDVVNTIAGHGRTAGIGEGDGWGTVA
jgi:hypothetical protein